MWLETIKNLAGCRRIYEWSDVIWAVVNGLHGRILTFLLLYFFQAVAYAVWSERNLRRIGDPSLPASCLIARLDKLIINRITSLRRRKGGKFEKAMEVLKGSIQLCIEFTEFSTLYRKRAGSIL